MTKYLFISKYAEGVWHAWRLQELGHEIIVYIDEEHYQEEGNGLILNKAFELKKDLFDWANIIIFDETGWGDLQDDLRRQGKKVIGGGTAEELETNRQFGYDVAKQLGLAVPEHRSFGSVQELINFVSQNKSRYVLKVSGERIQPWTTFIGQMNSGEDVIEISQAIDDIYKNQVEEWMLSEFVEGIEVGIAAYFDGEKFLKPYNINFEHKRLANNELGINTGEMGTLMINTLDRTRLTDELLKYQDYLSETNYVGMFDVGGIATDDKYYYLEVSARLGYPATYIEQGLNNQTIVEDFDRVLRRQNLDWRIDEWSIGVVVVGIGFPYEETVALYSEYMPVVMPLNAFDNSYTPQNIKKEGNFLRMSEGDGIIAIVTATGKTISEAQSNVYTKVKSVKSPGMFYRTDIGERVKNEIDRLIDWGYV